MLTSAVLLVLALLAAALGLALYFLPTIIAQQKRHRSLGGIFVLNLLLGWSLLGWIGALVWALSNPAPVIIVQNNPAYLQPGVPAYPPQPAQPQQPAYGQQPGYAQQPAYPPQPVYPYAERAAVTPPSIPAGYAAQPGAALPVEVTELSHRSDTQPF